MALVPAHPRKNLSGAHGPETVHTLHSRDCIVLSHWSASSLRVTSHGMTRNSGCTFSGPPILGRIPVLLPVQELWERNRVEGLCQQLSFQGSRKYRGPQAAGIKGVSSALANKVINSQHIARLVRHQVPYCMFLMLESIAAKEPVSPTQQFQTDHKPPVSLALEILVLAPSLLVLLPSAISCLSSSWPAPLGSSTDIATVTSCTPGSR